jgi:hypothetical protein
MDGWMGNKNFKLDERRKKNSKLENAPKKN